MSKCPDCGRENVPNPCGSEAHCGRRIQYNDVPDDWRVRVRENEVCKEIGRQRRNARAVMEGVGVPKSGEGR